jgi:hypothetical protein
VLLGGGDAVLDFLEHVEVVLDVLEGALVGELIQQRFDIAFGGADGVISWFRPVGAATTLSILAAKGAWRPRPQRKPRSESLANSYVPVN